GRLLRGAVARGDADARARAQFLVRTSGLGICRYGPLLAVVPVRRADALASPRRARALADADAEIRNALDHRAAVSLDRRHRPLLRGGADVGRAHAYLDGRILALVAGASLGRR